MDSHSQEKSITPRPKPDFTLESIEEYVWVQCGNFRTLAFLDQKGVWRAVATNEELAVTKVLSQT